MKRMFLLYLLLAFLPGLVMAQEGPYVPCVGCENLTQTPYPETGLWYNPAQTPGTALNFEIQNGVLAGFLYGYDDEGRPEWELVSGQLQSSEEPGVMWVLETNMVRASGGSCRDCAYTAPQITEGDPVRLEFMQRNYMRVTVGGYDQYLVPFIYGSGAKAYFPNKTPYLLPEFNGVAGFIVSVLPDPASSALVKFLGRNDRLLFVNKAVVSEPPEKRVHYNIRGYPPGEIAITPEPPPIGIILCEVFTGDSQPACRIEIDEVTYFMPIGNFSDTRFYAQAEDGTVIEGVRLDYD